MHASRGFATLAFVRPYLVRCVSEHKDGKQGRRGVEKRGEKGEKRKVKGKSGEKGRV